MWGGTLGADLSLFGGDPTNNTQEVKREETLKSMRNDHTCARSMNTKRDTRSKHNKGRYKRPVVLPNP
jgi:hypothetical protein